MDQGDGAWGVWGSVQYQVLTLYPHTMGIEFYAQAYILCATLGGHAMSPGQYSPLFNRKFPLIVKCLKQSFEEAVPSPLS